MKFTSSLIIFSLSLFLSCQHISAEKGAGNVVGDTLEAGDTATRADNNMPTAGEELTIDLSEVTYSKEDSAQVELLLRKGLSEKGDTPLTLFYANQLMSIPYVSATLEVNPEEHLAINLTQLDCTTLIENVMAFCLATQHQSTRFEDFCYWLQQIRYRDGKLDGYASRNHYFTQWVNSNTRMGLVQEIQGDETDNHAPFTASKTVDLHFMTANTDKYPLLKKEKQQGLSKEPSSQTSLVRQYEQEASGKVIRYIPKSILNKGKDVLGSVHDGDILALVTNKDGLDVTHLGLAVWGKDGKLHLLNASSIYHKVLLDPTPLHDYMAKRTYLVGIRVVRPKFQ